MATGDPILVNPSNETGTGKIVRDTSPTLITPILGVATGTTIDTIAETNQKTYRRTKQYYEGASHAAKNVVGLTYSSGDTTAIVGITVKYTTARVADDDTYAYGIYYTTWKKHNATAFGQPGAFSNQGAATFGHPTFAWSGDTLQITSENDWQLMLMEIEVFVFGNGGAVGVSFA